jgi:DNA-3-methyladenine glycosylase II
LPAAQIAAGKPLDTTPKYWSRAKRALSASDGVLAGIIARHPRISLQRRGEPFFTLARSIVGQQISVRAAQTIWDRLAAAVPAMLPEHVVRLEADALRACGLSARKAEYLHDLSQKFFDGTLHRASWHEMSDEEVIGELVKVRGIGRWTAEMFLIFNLQRPDVLPLDDIGLQRAMRLHYFRGRKVSLERMRRLGASWQPWRSVATWYLWRSLDPVPVEY